MKSISIQPETPDDIPTIHRITTDAFRPMPFSDGDEPDLVDKLRQDGDLTLSLVAKAAEAVVGHIAFSPVTISDETLAWYGLGPVSVTPALQKQGIGSGLILRGIADMRERSARGIVLLGDPIYYRRFGFEHDPELKYPGAPPRYFQRLVLEGQSPHGIVRFAPAFG